MAATSAYSTVANTVFFGWYKAASFSSPVVGNPGDAEMNFLRIRIAAVFQFCLGENLEQRSFAYLRQADNSSFHDCPKSIE